MDMDAEVWTVALAALGVFNILLGVLVIILFSKVKRLRKRLNKIIGNANTEHVDDLLLNLRDQIAAVAEHAHANADAINGIRKVMRKMKSNVAMNRYNAFSQAGSDLSFSIAILDEEADGVVLTGIHSREESYLYAKPVEKGQSSYSLSPEEKSIIAQAAGNQAT